MVEDDLVVPVPHVRRDDHVDHAGLVLDVEKHGALRGGRALAVGDEPAGQRRGAVVEEADVGGGGGSEAGEVAACVLDGVGGG
ncbi:hypothetical protein [Streptomyces inusitatus]|uniref:hypothetical protein n=1 Tax=Streptomyces inusitatus TaxID=68221 RepID=UPI00167D81A6|nr:hypothetical protein [Streptomyces inusitatus]